MTRQWDVRRAVAIGGALTLALGLAACGGGSGASADQASYNAMKPAQLAKAAAEEGTVTWYTTFASDDVTPVLAAFNKTYPKIKVNVLRLSADQIPPRIMTEQKAQTYDADVVSGDSPQVAQLISNQALQPFTPPDAPRLPAGLTLPKGYEGVVYALTTAIVYNPAALKQQGLSVPESWEDLTKPEWRGKFSIDPAAINWYDPMIQIMGHDKALGLLKKLGQNDPVAVESHTQAITDVQSGEPIATATGYGYKAAQLADKTPDRVAFMNADPMPVSLNLVDVVKNAPHPAAARLLDDWLVSKAGQEAIVAQTKQTSIRSDVKNDATVWSPSRWKPAFGQPMMKAADYNSDLSEYQAALGVQ